jgi:hypothetical protein
MSTPTTTPLLLAVIEALGDALRPISFTSARLQETFSMQDRVYIGFSQLGADKTAPYLTVTEAPEQDTASVGGAGRVQEFDKMYFIQGFAPRAGDIATREAYELQALVLSRLGRAVRQNDMGGPMFPAEYLLGLEGQGVVSIETTVPLVVSPERQVANAAVFYLPVLIKLAIDAFQPYRTEG